MFASTPQRLVLFAAEDSPSGLGRTLGKRVGGNPSRVRISYPPHPPVRADEGPDRIIGRGPRRWLVAVDRPGTELRDGRHDHGTEHPLHLVADASAVPAGDRRDEGLVLRRGPAQYSGLTCSASRPVSAPRPSTPASGPSLGRQVLGQPRCLFEGAAVRSKSTWQFAQGVTRLSGPALHLQPAAPRDICLIDPHVAHPFNGQHHQLRSRARLTVRPLLRALPGFRSGRAPGPRRGTRRVNNARRHMPALGNRGSHKLLHEQCLSSATPASKANYVPAPAPSNWGPRKEREAAHQETSRLHGSRSRGTYRRVHRGADTGHLRPSTSLRGRPNATYRVPALMPFILPWRQTYFTRWGWIPAEAPEE